jgi:RNA polymerase sigma factor (sigma-70 family)
MAGHVQPRPFHDIQRLFNGGVLTGLPDAELVARFAVEHDPDVFAILVARHGPTVMAVCRGILGPTSDDDAFQATFLVLLKRAGTFPVGDSLGGWLRRVARRVARQARIADARRQKRESAATPRTDSDADISAERAEIIRTIRREIDCLPERYRSPIVLCDIEGLTRDEAASLLGCPPGTVGGRLARARRRLRESLERHGISPSVATPLLTEMASPGFSWRHSIEASVRAASSLAIGTSAAPAITSLAVQGGRAAIGIPIKLAIAAGLVSVAAIGFDKVGAENRAKPEPPVRTASAREPAPARPLEPIPRPNPDDPKEAAHYVGRVVDDEDRPIVAARLYLVTGNEPNLPEAGPVRAFTGTDGRFDFVAPDMTLPGPDGSTARKQGLLMVAADGYAPDWLDTWGHIKAPPWQYPPKRGADLTLRLARANAPISGRLLDPKGRPLEGAHILVITLRRARKDRLDDHLERLRRGDLLSGLYSERHLYRPGVLPGFVREFVSDRDGRFTIKGLGQDWVADLLITAPGVRDTFAKVMTRDAPDIILQQTSEGLPPMSCSPTARTTHGANFTLRLRPGLTVHGTVRDRVTRRPLAGMTIRRPLSHHSGWDPRNSEKFLDPVVSDAMGRFTISGIDPELPHRELTALPSPASPDDAAKATTVQNIEVVIDCPRVAPLRTNDRDKATGR